MTPDHCRSQSLKPPKAVVDCLLGKIGMSVNRHASRKNRPSFAKICTGRGDRVSGLSFGVAVTTICEICDVRTGNKPDAQFPWKG